VREIFGTKLRVSLSLSVTKLQTMNVHCTVEVILHSFLNSVRDRRESSPSKGSLARGQAALNTQEAAWTL